MKHFFLIILMLLILSINVEAKIIYINNFNSSDEVQELIDGAKNGDVILFKNGIYKINTIYIRNKKNIYLSTETGRNDVDFDFKNNKYGIMVHNSSNIKIENFLFKNAHEGLVLYGNVKSVFIKKCIFKNLHNRGIFSNGISDLEYPKDITISYCYFRDIGSDSVGADISLGNYCTNFNIFQNKMHGLYDGIVMSGSSTGHIIHNNEISNHIYEDGIDIKNTYKRTSSASNDFILINNNIISNNYSQTGITVQMGSTGVVLMDNIIENNLHGIWINDHDTKNVKIISNDIKFNKISAISINQNAKGLVEISFNSIKHNSFFKSEQVNSAIIITSGDNYSITNNDFALNGLLNDISSFDIYISSNIAQLIMKNNKYESKNLYTHLINNKKKYLVFD